MHKLLEVSNIRKSFHDGEGDTLLLNSVNLSVAKGEKIAVIGSSGSGKTSLLHIVSGLTRPTLGEVCYQGKNFCEMKESQVESFRMSNLGFMFQRQYFIPELTVLANVAMPLYLRKDTQADEKAANILKSLDIPEKLYNQLPAILSGGEQSRVGLARALVHEPEILIADEPSASLDHVLTKEIFTYIEAIQAKRQFSMVVATHDHSLLEYFDTIYQLQDGVLKELKDV
jgi:lipoprotein-releasing system ATP-binding protein